VGAANATVNGTQGQGAAYVYVKPESGWTNMTETAKLTASNGVSQAAFGLSSSIEGNIAVIGAPQPGAAFPGPGASYVFVEPSGGWKSMTETAELKASDATDDDDFGYATAIDNNTIVVGAPYSGNGATYVFVKPPSGWRNTTETAKLTSADGFNGDLFGIAVATTGSVVAVGASNHNAGRAYVFVEPRQGWVNMTQTAEFKNNVDASCFGNSIALSSNAMLVGANCAQLSTGEAFLFLKPRTGWRNNSLYRVVLSVPFSSQGDDFAESLAISGKAAVIGAPLAPTFPPCHGTQCQDGPGEAFIFTVQ